MPDLHALAAGFALSAALIVAIGAQNAFVLRQGLRREHVGSVVIFCAVTDALLMTAGILGMGALLERVPALSLGLTLGGAAFLAWYGATALRRAMAPEALLAAAGGAGGLSLPSALGRAAGFTFLNPHVYLDTVLLVGTVGSAQAPEARGLFLLGACLASAAWFTGLGFGARLLAPLFARPAAWRVLDGAIGATMLALAAGLLVRAATRLS